AMLGIIIGISSVIALVSLGQASQQSIQSRIEALGSNLLTILPGAQTTGGIRGATGGDTTLTYTDAKAMIASKTLPDIQNVSPELSRRTQITGGSSNTNTQVVGVINTYAPVHNVTMSEGSFISAQDSASLSKVAVLGPQVVSDLFNGADPIGQTIRVNRIAFRVIGVTQSKGGSGFQNQDDMVFIPLETAQKQIFGIDYLTSIAVQAKTADAMTNAENEAGYFLLAQHKLSDPTKADFSILSQSDILGTATQVTGTFTTLLSGIAAISLLVGGIGIMNIMLVTVTERIREIGLRKALGAMKKTIITQFLVEAIMLTFAGGIIGMILGIAISYVLATFALQLPFVLSWFAVVLAIIVSGG
ncbi:MAG: ABC transporter permease, partial [Patescibacteria group bacterium]|nr:ABC transporter permease [Patescibacteria group bacterium]